MKIERIGLSQFKMPLIAPFATSFGVSTEESHIIVRIDSEGITGWGECVAMADPYYSYETNQTAWHILRDFLIPSVVGKNIGDVEEAIEFWDSVRGHNMAKAGLESALWDLFAKAAGVSLAKMLGGTRDRISVGVSIGIQSSPGELVKRVAAYLKEGYGRIKIKIAPGRDVAYAKAVRKEFPNILLQVDANSAYELNDLATLKEMDDLNLLLIEQPLGYDDIFDHAKIQRDLKTPICLDESIHSYANAAAAIELNACRIINIKPGRVGGFEESRRIHDLCLSKNMPVWHGGMLESGIGRAGNVALASLPNFKLPGDISANSRYYKEDIVDPLFELGLDGTLAVPTAPGIGTSVIVKKLEFFTVRKEEFIGR